MDGAWSGPVLFGTTAGEQLDASALTAGGQIHAAWLGRNQAGTGDQIHFAVVPIVVP